MRTNIICCLHPSSSPHHNNHNPLFFPSSSSEDEDNQPARPSTLTLNAIFALAALPGDHPHGLGVGLPCSDGVAGHAGGSDETGGNDLSVLKGRRFVRKSPSSPFYSFRLVQRVGRRLRRRATFGEVVAGVACGGDGGGGGGDAGCLEEGLEGGSFRDEARFDSDAKRLSSGEVLGAVEVVDGDSIGYDTDVVVGGALTSGIVRSGGAGAGGDPPMLRLRELSPLDGSRDLGRYGNLDCSSSRAAAIGSFPIPVRRAHSSFALGSLASSPATTVAAATGRAGRTLSSEVDEVELRNLAHLNSTLDLDLAEYQLDGISISNNSRVQSDGDDEPVLMSGGLEGERAPTPVFSHVVEPDDHDDSDDDNNTINCTSDSRADSHASFHLTKNNISQQLRSMSQLSSNLSDFSEQSLRAGAWTFHYRERSCNFLSASAIDIRSNSGRSLHVAREHDASSSIYSRPTSPEVDQVVPGPYELPADLAEVNFGDGDWPLRAEQSSTLGERQNRDENLKNEDCSVADECGHITIIEPSLPAVTASSSASAAFGSGVHVQDDRPGRAPSHKSSSSSTTKRSRFLERFTPPKRSATKRRSIFNFLRVDSHRDQTRSISTPALCSPHLQPYVDGPADENELLTVQYELTPRESHPARSVSLSNLAVPVTNESQGVASSPDLRRKPSLAEYERHLSIVGDDRRLPSNAKELNINRLSQIEEDENHEHVSGKNSFSYHSKTQMTDPLMEAALERQLKEKAMFRSASKRSIPQSGTSGTSFLATSWDEPSSLQPQSPDRDPLDSVGGKRPSASHLSPPRTPVESRSRNSSFITSATQRPNTDGKKPVMLHTPSSISRSSIKSKIGSSLGSWSRYPSHTRNERCASAGRADNVRTLDFALDIKHERIGRGNDESDPFQPGNRTRAPTGKHSSKSKTKSLPKSRSATFGGTFARYYSTLFSSPDFHGKGRRTSVAVGGKLHRPELEILSPGLPSSSSSPVSQSVSLYLHELEHLCPGSDSTVGRQHMGTSSGKVKSPLISNKDASHLHVADGLGPSETPTFRSESMFRPLSSDIPNASERTFKAGQETSQPEGSDEDFSAQMGNSSSRSNSQESLANAVQESRRIDVDGTVESNNEIKPSPKSTPTLTPSESQAWSELYQDCLVVPPSPVVDGAHEDERVSTNTKDTNTFPTEIEISASNPLDSTMMTIMPPPPAAPAVINNSKLRSPIEITRTTTSTSLNPPTTTLNANPTMPTTTMATTDPTTATIRRYPSVTVIDDRKGHWRSVSFISVLSGKSGRSGGVSGSEIAETGAGIVDNGLSAYAGIGGSHSGSRAESLGR